MPVKELQALTMHELGAMIAAGDLSPVEITQASIDAIEQSNGVLGAFLSYYPEKALEAAAAAEAEISRSGPRGPLHGIPVAVKDLFEVSGMVRTCGSKVHKPQRCARDSTAVERLRQAGAIVMGMTSLNEYAYGPTGINPVAGSARNPWNLDRACGGSSAGSACAIAASLVWGALGTDTGGSIRIPSSHCGITGLKPTYGRVSRYGIYPLAASFDHAGPMAKSAMDCGLMLASIAGPDPQDPATWQAPPFVPADGHGQQKMQGLRIGVLRSFFAAGLCDEVATAFDNAMTDLAGMGAVLSEIEIPGLDEAMDAWVTISQAEAYAVHAGHIRDRYEDLSPDVARRLAEGHNISITAYLAARDIKDAFLSAVAEALEHIDLMATPTTPIPAVFLDTGTIEIGGKAVAGADVLGRFLRLANLTGQPALSLPCGTAGDGMPVGLQIIGPWFAEEKLIAIACAYQEKTDWHRRRPPAL